MVLILFIQFNSLIDPRVLEIGSRSVNGRSLRSKYDRIGNYIGFDIHSGVGVDVVGDAHRLSDHFKGERFDAVIAVSTFEHLLFPWKVVLEINRVLRVGGVVLIVTHPVWPAHELPWDFWRYPEGSFRALFNEYTGFVLLLCKEGLPARAYSLSDDKATRALSHSHLLKQGVAVLAVKTADYRSDLLRWDLGVGEVMSTAYPLNSLRAGGIAAEGRAEDHGFTEGSRH